MQGKRILCGEVMKVIDLFSGIGGLSLGFKQAGYEIVAAVEIDPKRSVVYRRNISPKEMINEDIRKVDFTQYKGLVDVVVAGPPCQPYSAATPPGKRGVDHPFYGLETEVVRVASEVKPLVVVVEEVLRWNPTWLVRQLNKLGYTTMDQVFDMSKYGVPMMRNRWILVAVNNELINSGRVSLDDFPPSYMQRERPPRTIDVIKDLPPDPCDVDPCRWNGAIIYNHVNAEINSKLKEIIPKIPPGYSLVRAHRKGIIDASKYVKDINKKHSYWLYRAHPDKPLPTVPHPRRSMLLHPTYNRMITVRELARLYTYPDDFNLRPLNTEEMYRAITDSVPPKFSKKLAISIMRMLNKWWEP